MSDDGRSTLEGQRDDLTATINRLISLVEAGAGDVAEVVSRLQARKAEREGLERRLATMAAPPDRARLRELLEQRATDWRGRLRGDHPEEARFVVRQLIGPLTLWVGKADDLAALADNDGRGPSSDGKENIDFDDCGFVAQVTPQGLLNGLGAFNMVAGARSRLYRLSCTWWRRDRAGYRQARRRKILCGGISLSRKPPRKQDATWRAADWRQHDY